MSVLTLLIMNFNPRAPRGARPHSRRSGRGGSVFQSTCPARGTTAHSRRSGRGGSVFQSTCPARGTTRQDKKEPHEQTNFNPRAPRGARPLRFAFQMQRFMISIHVPREGHDIFGNELRGNGIISIHVPREGHDSKHAQFFRADLRKSYKYPAERDALPTKNVCKHIKTLG